MFFLKRKQTPFLFFSFLLLTFISLFTVNEFKPVLFYFEGSYNEFSNWFPTYYRILFLFIRLFYPIILSIYLFSIISNITKVPSLITFFQFCLLFFVSWFHNICFLFIYFIFLSISFLVYVYSKKISDLINYVLRATKFQNNVYYFVTFLIIILSVCFRIGLVFYTENSSEADASCRVLLSQIYADYYLTSGTWDRVLNPIADWLPLHFYISGFILKFTSSIKLVRLFHAIAGVITSFFVYKIGEIILNKQIGLLTAIGYLIYPASIYTSIEVMSEPFFLLFLLTTVFCFLNTLKSGDSKYYIFTILSVNACCLLRYEGWLIPVFLLFISIVYTKSLNNKLLYMFLLSSLSPLIIAFLLYYQGFHPLRGILYSDMQVAYCFSVSGKSINVFLNGYKASWIPFSFIALIISLFFYRKNKFFFNFIFFSFLFFLPFLYKNFTLTLFPQYRYLVYYEVLFLFPLSFLLSTFFQKLSTNFFISNFCSLLVIILLSSFSYREIPTDKFHFPSGYNESISFVNENVNTGYFILDHHKNVGTYNWIAATKLPILLNYRDDYLKQFIDFNTIREAANEKLINERAVKFMVNDYESEFKKNKYYTLDTLLDSNDNFYVVLFPGGDLNGYFHFSKNEETKNGRNYKLVFSKNGYLIYTTIR